jgi:2-polyprenyl-3-methyl-5-hydroxy-6-metoxy-1,4-benzoquinol methylase
MTADAAGEPAYFDRFDPSGSSAAGAARQILDVTRPFRAAADTACDVLDIGCGYGHTAVALAKECRRVVAIEPSIALYDLARKVVANSGVTNLELANVGVEKLAPAYKFDLVVLDNVLEHIAEQQGALAAIAAAMAPRGALYLLVPNKLWPIEPHYRLPFLSYLPLPFANRYLRITRRGTDYADASHAPTYGRLTRLLEDAGLTATFVVPADLSATAGGAALHYRIGAAMLRRMPWLWRLAKGFLVVATKRAAA